MCSKACSTSRTSTLSRSVGEAIETTGPLEDAVIYASSIVLIGSFFWAPGAAYYVYKRKCKTRRQKVLFSLGLVLLLFFPVPQWRKLLRFPLWRLFARYFRVSAVGNTNQDGKLKQALYCLVPHGIFPFGIGLSCLTDINRTVFNDMRPIVANVMRRVPVIGPILRAIGAVPAEHRAIDKAFAEGLSLGLAPGGIGEMYYGHPRPGSNRDTEYILLKGRLGFIKRAIKAGVPLIPVYVFGSTDAFHRAPLPTIVEKLSRTLRVSLVLFWGRFGLPIPFKVPMTFAVGDPITVTQNNFPTDEEASRVHAVFCAALKNLFERYKGGYGWGHKTLEIV